MSLDLHPGVRRRPEAALYTGFVVVALLLLLLLLLVLLPREGGQGVEQEVPATTPARVSATATG